MPGHHISQAVSPSAARAAINYIDETRYFVRQQYLDFLGREPDVNGLNFWSSGIEACGGNAGCRDAKRVDTSAAFFLSIEFQETGYLVYRLYKAAFGNEPNRPVPIRRDNFIIDTREISEGVVVGVGNWAARLEANKTAFALDFVGRDTFEAVYDGLSPAQFVDKLNQNAEGILTAAERQALVNDLTANDTAAVRAAILRRVADNQTLRDREFNKAFVLMQYFGYMRRNPNEGQDTDFRGLNFWLGKLNEFGGDFRRAQMVQAFIESIEYRDRFAQPQLTIFSNPADPLLLRAVTAKDEVIEYFGEKNTQGLATALKSISVKDSDDKVTSIALDGQGRPARIRAFNGVVITITWVSQTDIVITALTADGTAQVNLPVDLAAPPPPPQVAGLCEGCGTHTLTKSTRKTLASVINRAPRGGAPAELAVARPSGTKGMLTTAAAAQAATSLVNVTRCGRPVNNADVSMTVIPSSEPSEAYIVPGASTGGGQYSVSIPTQPSPGQEAEDACDKISDVLGVGCDIISTVPPNMEYLLAAQLSAIVTAIATPAAGLVVFTAFTVGFRVARLLCNTVGWSPGEPGMNMPAVSDLICSGVSEIVDRFASSDVRLIPLVFIPGEGVVDTGSGATAPGSGPFPNFNVDAGGEVKIVSFTTTPADPAPEEGYVAEALIECAPQGTTVTMSIVGTDGYEDSKTATIQGDANVTLTVPGAAQGVQDVITVTIGGGGPTRAIAIVF
jgi:hypothetical protein